MCIVCDARRYATSDYKLLFGRQDSGVAFLASSSKADKTDEPQETSAVVSRNSASGVRYIDALIGDFRFASSDLTFSFPTSASAYEANYGTTANNSNARTVLNSFAPLNPVMQGAARATFAMAAAYSELAITETTGSANFRLGLYTPPANNSVNFAMLPGTNKEAGDVWLTRNGPISPVIGNEAWLLMIHEIGHALGMWHPFSTDGVGKQAFTREQDSMEFSVMTYRSFVGGSLNGYTNERWSYAQSFMMYDIAAIQYMYGADFTTNATDSVYRFSSTTGEMFVNDVSQGTPGANRIFLTIWDGGGNDTYDLSNYAETLKLDLQPGLWSQFSQVQTAVLGNGILARGSVFNALQYRDDSRSLIENAIGGSQADSITGNQANNQLEGREGNDTLDGHSGDDQLLGGSGIDSLLGNLGNDTLDGGSGADILDGGDGFDFASYANAMDGLTLFMGGRTANTGEANGDIHTSIEGLIGSNFSDVIGGDDSGNDLRGLNGNDFIYGRAGIDTLLGGDGNDVLSGGLDGDRLDGGAGIDVAFYRESAVGLTASLLTGGGTGEADGDIYLNIENIWGSDFDDILTGDNLEGQVYGFAGNDQLSGLDGEDYFYGGQGFDTLTGGGGIDNFFLLSWNDHTNQFGTLEPYEGGDTYTDFASGTDKIILSRYWFGFGNIGGPAAALTETHANFVTNGNVATSRPSLIWNNSARTLSFDADGNGATQAVLLGTFQQSVTLALGDIWTA